MFTQQAVIVYDTINLQQSCHAIYWLHFCSMIYPFDISLSFVHTPNAQPKSRLLSDLTKFSVFLENMT